MSVSEIEKHRRRWEENPRGLTFAPYADALRKSGDAETALDVLRAGLEHHADYIPANIVFGRCHLDLGDDVAAAQAFERVLTLDPENVIALRALADIAERAADYATALRWLGQLDLIDRADDATARQADRIREIMAAAAAAMPPVPAVPEPAAEPEADASDSPAEATAPEPTAVVETAAESPTLEPASVHPAAPAVEDVHLDLAAVSIGEPSEAPISLEVDVAPTFEPPAEVASILDAPVAVPTTLEAVEGLEPLDVAVVDAADVAVSALEPAVTENAEHLPTASVVAPEVAISPEWADMGHGEFVPALFGDAPPPASAVSDEALGLEPATVVEVDLSAVAQDEPTGAVVENAIAADLPLADLEAPLHETEVRLDATSESVSVSVDEAAAPMMDAVTLDVDGAADMAPVLADAAEDAAAVSPAEVVAPTPHDEAPHEALAIEAPMTEAAEDAVALEAVTAAFEDGVVETTDQMAVVAAAPHEADGRVRVPGIVTPLAMPEHEIAAADAAALALVRASFRVHNAAPLRDVLADAPAAEYVEPSVADVATSERVAVRLPEETFAGEADAGLAVLPAADASEAMLDGREAIGAQDVDAAPPSSEPTPAGVDAAESEDEDDAAAAPPNFAAPVLVTAAMAVLYRSQGHLAEALDTYRQLDAREPGVHASAIAELERELEAAQRRLPRPPVYAAVHSGGQPVRDWFGALLRTVPPSLVRRAVVGTPAIRKADDAVSLGRLFGDEPAPAPSTRPLAVAPRAASYDEFYGGAGSRPAEQRDDLEQFHTWLQGLKT